MLLYSLKLIVAKKILRFLHLAAKKPWKILCEEQDSRQYEVFF